MMPSRQGNPFDKNPLGHFGFWLAMGLEGGLVLGVLLGNIGAGLLIGLAMGLERGSWYFWYDR